MKQLIKSLVEIGPVVVFFAAYFYFDDLILATSIFIPVSIAALAWARISEGRWPPMLLVTVVIVAVFGGFTIVFQNETFIKIKPTAVYLIFATALLGGLATGRNLIEKLMSSTLDLPAPAWRTLAIRWALFFLFMAGINEFVWRNFPTDFWISFKLFGALPLTFLFALAQTPLIMRHMQDEDEAGK